MRQQMHVPFWFVLPIEIGVPLLIFGGLVLLQLELNSLAPMQCF